MLLWWISSNEVQSKACFYSTFKEKVKISIVKYFDILYKRVKEKLFTTGLSSWMETNLINEQILMETFC